MCHLRAAAACHRKVGIAICAVLDSVFECSMDSTKCAIVKAKLTQLIDPEKDSLRFYYLGNNYANKIEHIGVKASYDPEGPLLI